MSLHTARDLSADYDDEEDQSGHGKWPKRPHKPEEIVESEINSDLYLPDGGADGDDRFPNSDLVEYSPITPSLARSSFDAEVAVSAGLRNYFRVDSKAGGLVSGCSPGEGVLSAITGAYVFFPGLIFHELSHLVAAKIAGVRILESQLWGKHGAYVVIESPKKSFNSIFVAMAPLVFGSLASALLFNVSISIGFTGAEFFPAAILFWLALSIGMWSPVSVVDWATVVFALNKSYLTRKRSASFLTRLVAYFYWPLYYASLLILGTGIVFHFAQYFVILGVYIFFGVLSPAK